MVAGMTITTMPTGQTAVMLAAMYGRRQMVNDLVEAEANLDLQDDTGEGGEGGFGATQ